MTPKISKNIEALVGVGGTLTVENQDSVSWRWREDNVAWEGNV